MDYLPEEVNGHFQPAGEDEGGCKYATVGPGHFRAVHTLLALAGGEHQAPELEEEFDGGRDFPAR